LAVMVRRSELFRICRVPTAYPSLPKTMKNMLTEDQINLVLREMTSRLLGRDQAAYEYFILALVGESGAQTLSGSL
jgi:hypothetical protein